MTEGERKKILKLADMLQDEIYRMCVTKDLAEFNDMYGYAKKNLEKLSKLIYFCKFKPESKENK